MRDRCVDLLAPSIEMHSQPVVVDATLGLGGHTEALLSRFPQLTVIGIDRDTRALEKAKKRLAVFGDRVKTSHAIFDEISEVVAAHGFTQVSGVLFDLGVSSM